MTNKKADELRQRIEQDENCWLKVVSETGDIARMIISEREEHKELERKIQQLTNRINELEIKLIPILTQEVKPNETKKAN